MNLPANPCPALLLAAGIALTTFGFLLFPGCTKPTPPPEIDPQQQAAAGDPWAALGQRLRKETDVAAVKSALGQLVNDLAGRQGVAAPQAMSPETEKKLTSVVPLSESDVAATRAAGYSGLDAAYIADSLYLRDSARSLDPVGLPTNDLVRAGFEWICRQVYLNPWTPEIQPGVRQAMLVPPTAVLRRGHGSGLERAYVFLDLLRQMGIDGCLIGPPDAANLHAGNVTAGPDGQPLTGSPKGPFWAVGARVGGDILLFEPWRGSPFPGPDGKGIGTLAQIKKNPAQAQAWLDDKTWGVTADDLKSGVVFLAVPLSGLSPRMALLDEKLKRDLGVVLAIDPAAVRARFTAAAPNGPGLPPNEVSFWNPPGDAFSYTRVLASFLPAEEGGTDRSPPGRGLRDQYMLTLLPRSVLALPRELEAQPARERLAAAGAASYEAAFLAPPTPRERIQRGQIQDATRYLADRQDSYVRGLERLRNASPTQITQWCNQANEVYAELRRAQYPDPLQRQPQPESDPTVIAARQAVEAFWKTHAQTAQVIIDQASARLGLAEATYLLALAKHEEAERQQLRADRAIGGDAGRAKSTAQAAWNEAANAWRSYLEQSSSLTPLPARNEHARLLSDRAVKLANAK
jgi:hypothetical protein